MRADGRYRGQEDPQPDDVRHPRAKYQAELAVRKALSAAGLRYRLHSKLLPGETGHRASGIASRHLRARLLLAPPCPVQVCVHPEVEHQVLAGEVCLERAPRQVSKISPAEGGVAGAHSVGVRGKREAPEKARSRSGKKQPPITACHSRNLQIWWTDSRASAPRSHPLQTACREDNSKQQIYLGGSFEVLQLLPYRNVRTDPGFKRETFKAELDFNWIDAEGQSPPAPGAQLILYPKYPEVRLSGFLRGCSIAPGDNMRPIPRVSAHPPARMVVCFSSPLRRQTQFLRISPAVETS